MKKTNLTCPHCKHVQEIEIPQTGCLAFHKCEKCEQMISVPEGSKNCCVICEYADRKCPAPNVTKSMDSKKLKRRFLSSVVGTVVVVICCFTPILVAIFTGIGLSLFIPYLDFVLFPALLIMLIVTFISYKRWKRISNNLNSELKSRN